MPGDKSISHRALMLASIAEGKTLITGLLESLDTLATMNAFNAMGVKMQHDIDNQVIVNGAGTNGLLSPSTVLDMGNSGTSARLLAGLLAGLGIECELIGDDSLMSRPMQRIIEPLQKMQAMIAGSEKGTLPIKISGGRRLKAIEFAMPIASAQIKSSILLAGLNAEGRTHIYEPIITRDHTECMLQQFGYPLQREGQKISLDGGGVLHATNITIPGDLSSATFFIIGACIAEGSEITIKNVGVNPTRNAVISILREMGADITLLDERRVSNELVADIQVKYAPLCGININSSQVPIAIDELPAIMIAAASAKGQTTLTHATELRFKESDRILAMTSGLQTLGINAQEHADGMTVTGGDMSGGDVNSFGDHRIAMAFAMAGLNASSPIIVQDCANVETSFPNFVDIANQVGLDLQIQ